MWPQQPPAAKTHVPFRSHEDVQSMGDDAYIRNSSNGTPSPAPSSGDHHSATSLRGAGAAMGTAGVTGGARRRSVTSIDSVDHDGDSVPSEDDEDTGIKPGMPIGFLAALGTPYAKKPIYRSKKCKILCPLLGGITAIVTILITIFPVLRAIAIHTLHTSVLTVSTSNITSPTNSSFGLTLEGQAQKASIFPARLFFERPVQVFWISPEEAGAGLAPGDPLLPGEKLGDGRVERQLGQFALEPIGVAAGHGRIKQKTVFHITNETAFARFTEYLITQEEFTWRLKSESVQAKAFGFIAANKLNFVKDLTLPGMANMTDVSIADFQLPGNDPAGGISLSVVTKLTNPSAFGVEIGTLVVGLYYNDLFLGPAQTAAPINLTAGVNHIHLVGRLLPYTDNPAALVQLSTLFSNYLNGEVTMTQARGISVTLPNGDVIDWLQKGIQALILTVPLQSPTGRISPITGITIEALSLAFDPTTPYAPMANSSQVSATFGLPFGFSLNIVELANTFSIVDNKTAVANLSSPLGMSTTTILTQNAGFTTGGITLDLPLAPLVIGPSYDEHLAFSQFTYDLTTTNGSQFILIGSTDAVTDTPLGQVKLHNIGFTVPAGLIGLQSLAAYPTTILSVDVLGGTPDAVLLNISVGLTNPSNLDLQVQNVTFQLYNNGSFLGTTVLPDLHLTTGYQEHAAVGYFQANNNPVALQTLTDFAQGTSNNLKISGFNGSTATDSLTQAFMALHLNATLNGLTTKLLNYANLTVLSSTGVADDFADSIVSLANPFTSPLRITNIQSNITSHGLFVGSIVTDTDFNAAGKTDNISPVLKFNLNLYPPDIFSLLRALVVQAGLDPVQLDGIIALGGYSYVPTSPTSTPARLARRSETLSEQEQGEVDALVLPGKEAYIGSDHSEHMFSPVLLDQHDEESFEHQLFGAGGGGVPVASGALVQRGLSKRNIYTGFDLPSFVLAAFKLLQVDVELVSVLHIGDFTTNLAYTQNDVPAYTDSTLTLLLPTLARPIVQKIVDGSILGVTTVMISNPSNAAFTTGLVGSITNAGPFDAVIGFLEGLTVAWNGAPLGQIAMPNISLVADVGATLNLDATFAVADLAHLTDFTGYLLTEPSFTWQIYGENLEVTALGITVGGISISKNVVLDGMNGFKGLVTIEAFDLPANDPAGGVSLTLQTSLQNPSSVGVELSTIGFSNTFGSTVIGPASSASAFSLLPKATIQLPLAGRLVPQTSAQGLADVSALFNGYLHGVPADLVVHGANAGPSDVTWLNEGIKQLAIAVILPAAQNLQVINSITINQMTLMFTEASAYAPAFSTNNTVALFQLPFAFPVDIQQIATGITAGDNTAGAARLSKRAAGDFAQLNVPMGPADTNVVSRNLLLTFNNVPFTSMDNGIFSNFLKETTDSASKSFALHGSADTVTSTAIGDLNLNGIAFTVQTAVDGLQGLNAQPATVSDLDVFHGYPSYLQINVNAHLFNPSPQITIGTGDVAFGLTFQGQTIGTADITGLVLVPGANVVPTAVHYQPSGGAATAAGQLLLENFVQGVASDTLIVGNSGTTPIQSLQAALESIQLGTTIPPLMQNLITQANLAFPLDIGTTGIADATVSLGNPFTASINIDSVITNATYQGLYLGQVNVQTLNPPISAPGHTAIVSPTLPLALNIDPKALIMFVEAAASAQGVDLGILLPQFQYVLGLASTASSVTSSVNQQPETCTPTGTTAAVQALILAAVKNLRTNLTVQSVVKLDDFQTPLNFNQLNVPTILDDSVLYLTGIIGKTIVSHIVDVAELSFSSGLVTNVTDNGFTAALKGSLLNAGPFDAQIEFPSGVDVIWMGSTIANIQLPPICAAGGQGVPDLETTGILQITNLARFTDFATYILLNPGFTWTITTNKLRVLALGTIFDNVTLTKNVSFSAFNGLPGVTIVNPDFPSDAPNGIALVTDSAIPSPSNLGIELGHVSFIANFQGQEVGPIDGYGLTLAPLATTDITLTGTIIKRTSAASTASLGVLFSQFLAGANQTLDVTGNQVITPAQPNSPVNWLSAAFKQLTLHVILPGHVYDIISSIKLRDLTVTILSQADAYAVPTQNNETDVVYKNPFGFSLTAIQAGGAFTINYNNVDTGLLTLPVADAVSAQTSTGQDANLVIDFKQKEPLVSLNNGAFNSFFNAITNTADVGFNLHGGANVTAQTNAGNIPITGIPFSVETDLAGLQSLNARPTVVSNLDVFHGYPTYLQINADATLFNPSTLTIITDQVMFGLQINGQVIGTVVIGDLLLIPNDNLIGTEVRYAPTGGESTVQGMLLLENFVQGVTSNVSIVGTPNTTPYGSLQEALGSISIQTSIPPLHQLLITEADLTFPIDIATTGIADAKFKLANPFTASINLLGVVANASYQTFFLGQINQPTLSPIISAGGHQNITSRTLPFTLTTDPKFLIQFLEATAAANGVDLGILVPEFAYVLGLASTASDVTTTVNTAKETCTPTGTTASVQALILAAVKNLKTDLAITSTLKLDDFQTDLNFVQNQVPTVLDDTVLYLTGLIGKTIVSHIVDDAQLAFSGGSVTNVTNNGFTVALQGSLLDAGPFDALIEFPAGVDVYWMGTFIANIILPPICSAGGSGVPNLSTTGILQITNLDGFTTFAAYILNNPSFTWTITTNKLRVSALGTIFDNVTLTKNVTFQAFNKLSPGVTLSNPDFPGDASNGIKLVVDSLIPSPSNLGIVLGDVSFVASFQNSTVGPVMGSDLTLPPMSTTALPLTGTITYRNDAAGLQSLGALFSQFLLGQSSILQVTGNEVISPAQPNSPVNWLSAAFKQLTLDVVLPGKQYTIISAIQLKDLDVTILDASQAYAASVTNNETDVTFQNPFKFSLKVLEAGGAFTINYNGLDSALLTLPTQPAVSSETSTGQPAALVIHIVTPATLTSLDNGGYNNFFTAITNTANVGFGLHGGANVTAQTAAGNIPIGGIPFSVTTSFPGIQGFNSKATIPTTPVVIGSGSGNEFAPTPGGATFIRITLTTILSNPAPIILNTNLISFEVIYRGYQVGRADVNPLNLIPGTNNLATEFHYEPADPSNAIAQDLLSQYLETTGAIPLTIQGDVQSSPYGSLQGALSGVTLQTSFPGQGLPLVHDIVIYLDPITALCDNTVTIETRLNNNLQTSITLLQLAGTASQGVGAAETQYASFDYTFKTPFRTNAGENPGAYSEMIGPVKLTKGAAGSLGLFATMSQGLNIDIVSRVMIDGYTAPSLVYSQNNVPYTIIVSVNGLALQPGSIGQVISDPLGSLGDLFTELLNPAIATCIGGVLSLLPGASGILGGLPPILTSLLGGVDSLLSALVPSAVNSLTSSLGRAASSVISQVTGGAGTILSSVTAGAGSVASSLVSDLTNAIAPVTSPAAPVVSVATGVVNTLLSGVGALASPTATTPTVATPAAAAAASTSTPAAGNVVASILNPILARGREEEAPDSIATSLSPTDYAAVRNFLAFEDDEAPLAVPTPAPAAPVSPATYIPPALRADMGAVALGLTPQELRQKIAKYGFVLGEPVEEMRAKRDARLAEEAQAARW